MSPSEDYEQKLEEAEKRLLDEKVSKLTQNDRDQIYKNGKLLLESQDANEDLSILPTLNVKDISRSMKKTVFERVTVNEIPVQYSAQPTNGIVYFTGVLQLKPENFPKKLIPYLSLFSQVMTKLGAGPWDRRQLDQEIQMRTNGLGSLFHIVDHPTHFDKFQQGLVISSHCLERNIEPMFNLWTEVFNRIRFDDDHDHLLQLIRISAAELAAGVSHNGHRYAMNRAASAFGGAMKLRELTNGMTSLAYFRLMAGSPDKIKEIVKNLKEVAEIVLNTQNLRCAINAEAASIRPSLNVLEQFIQSIRGDNQKNHANEMKQSFDTSEIVMPTLQSTKNEHFVFPFSTNFLSRSVFCAPFQHPDFAKLRIASSLISSKFLHKEIREKGGAYGGGARFDSGGVLSYYSYRDPQVSQTIDAFDRAGEWLIRTDNYSDQDIDESKLQVFQSVDAPIMPSEQGLEYFLTGIDDDMRQEYRLRLLDVQKADIHEVAER